MKHLIIPAVFALSIPANAGSLDNPWERPTVTVDGTAATLRQERRMSHCDIRARLEGWDARETTRCESGGTDRGGVSSLVVRDSEGGVAPTVTPPEQPTSEPEQPTGGPIVSEDPPREEGSKPQTKVDHLGGGSWDRVLELRGANGDWTQQQKDFHATGNPDWSQCGCRF